MSTTFMKLFANPVRYVRDCAGNVAMVFALSSIVLAGAIGMSLDYANWLGQQRNLQEIADASALAGARTLYLAGTGESSAKAAAETTAHTYGFEETDTQFIDVLVDANAQSVHVTLTTDLESQMSGLLLNKERKLSVEAIATALPGARICVIGLSEFMPSTLYLDTSAELQANGCAVYTNSTSDSSIWVQENSLVTSELTCTAGDYSGASTNFEPEPLNQCPPVEDPLKNRQPPAVGACDETGLEIVDQVIKLVPGVYCGSLRIKGSSSVTFAPGVYIIKDGIFSVEDTASVSGRGVGFYLAGTSWLTFNADTTIDLEAPVDGDMAGILIFEDRNSFPFKLPHRVLSNNAKNMLGTIYIPVGTLQIEAGARVAENSAYTAIIAQMIFLTGSPRLVLNTNYHMTDVPVPSGLAGDKVTLTR